MPLPTRLSGGSSGTNGGNGGNGGTGGNGVSGHGRRTSNVEPIPNARATTAERYFDPATDVDVRKRDTQAVLSRFMKVGTFSQSGGQGDVPEKR